MTTAAEILAVLDAAAASDAWPRDRHLGRRAIAARSGDAWGIAIEQLEGERPGAVLAPRVAVHAFGTKVKRAITARPLPVTGAPVHPNPYAAWIAARLAARPESLWGPATACLAALGLPKDATVALVVAALPPGPVVPSESGDFQALAAAIAD